MKMATRFAGLGALALTLGLLAPSPAQACTTTTVKVYANGADTPTLHIATGDSVTVTATGSVQYGYQGAPPCGPGYPTTTPDGSEYLNGVYCGTVAAGFGPPRAPMPDQPAGLLVGRTQVGGIYSAWFAIGASRTWTADNTGTLDLAINETHSGSGYYTATVSVNC